MSDYRNYSSKRFLIRYDDAIDESYCVLWAVPIGIAKIMQGLLSSRGLWRSSYVKQYLSGYYQMPDFTEFHELEDKIRAFLGGISMSDFCLSALIERLDTIAQAIQAQAQCCVSGTNGLFLVDDGSGGYYYGTEEPVAKPDTFGGGEEFASEAEFEAHLCSAANNIVSGLILSLNNWSIFTLSSLVAGGIVVGVFVANPPLGVIIALAVAAVGLTILASLSTHIADNRQAWVCEIFNASSYADFLVRLDILIDNMVVELDIGPLAVPITDLIHSVVSTDVFNRAYTAVGLPAPIDAVSCDDCEGALDCTLEAWFPGLPTNPVYLGDLDYLVEAIQLATPTRYGIGVIFTGNNTRVFDGMTLIDGAFTGGVPGNERYMQIVVDGIGLLNSIDEGEVGTEIAWANTFSGERVQSIAMVYSGTDFSVQLNFSGDCAAYSPP